MGLDIIWALLQQLLGNPVAALIILPVSILAFFLEIWKWFPSKYVPGICLLLGMVLYPCLASKASVPKDFPHPFVVLLLNGFILGFVASVVHVTLIKWIISKFQGPQNQQPPNDTP